MVQSGFMLFLQYFVALATPIVSVIFLVFYIVYTLKKMKKIDSIEKSLAQIASLGKSESNKSSYVPHEDFDVEDEVEEEVVVVK
ncbi:MAG: hypothetical protein QJR05_05355 [Thermoanaerobacterium sp.]|nr:hypothetical protein [Thermoanaerobacterium sp.]